MGGKKGVANATAIKTKVSDESDPPGSSETGRRKNRKNESTSESTIGLVRHRSPKIDYFIS